MTDLIRKIIRNNSGSTVNILNRQIVSGDSYEVSPNHWLKLYESSEIRDKVVSGDFIVNNGSGDLTVSEALKHLQIFQPYDPSFSPGKRRHIITMGYNGTCTNVWLRFHDNVNSNQSKWTPPVKLKILKVFFSNKYSGSSSNNLEMKITAYYKSFNSTGNISTSDSTAWYVTGTQSSCDYWTENGRSWVYDNSDEGDYMDVGYVYAFRLKRTNGYTSPNDATVWLYCEEVD